MLNWNPSNASMKLDFPSDCMPTTTNSGVSKEMLKLHNALVHEACVSTKAHEKYILVGDALQVIKQCI